ncbi:GNAT family N-acetyltransferase [Aestuariivita boseongensis]|uniref:GNAT family N-acetyltransferase n=1 Tax=Aestuariivita boseongensis TaxID=1470562 RepID=UPI0006836DFC|nr:GNAT family N-acetyltransferase [Aestuariivita boseongensis]
MITPLPPEALVLETDRLRLRPWGDGNADFGRDLLMDARVMRYVTGDPLSAEDADKHLAQAARRGAGGRIGIWCAELKTTGEPIGDGVLTPIPVEDVDVDWSQVVPDAYPTDQIEVGYLLKPSAWGQGYATEICRCLLRFGFEQTSLELIVACTDLENHASKRVLSKAGMYSYGTGRAYAEDVAWFELPRSDWAARQ